MERPRLEPRFADTIGLDVPPRPNLDHPRGMSVPGVEQHEFRARDGRAYRIFIAASAEAKSAPVGVIYQLDANAAFGTMVEAARLQARRTARTGVGPLLIVGIGYPVETAFDERRRGLDLTPWPSDATEHQLGPAGGADAFLDMIEHELVPLVERRFHVDPTRRGLFGHSFGGLFALHALFTRPHLFSTYAACSPSLWWNLPAVNAEQRAFLAAEVPRGRRLLVAVGGQEQPPAADAAGEEPGWMVGLRNKAMVDNARSLTRGLAATASECVSVRFEVLPDENHASVLPATIARWLRFFDETRPRTEEANDHEQT